MQLLSLLEKTLKRSRPGWLMIGSRPTSARRKRHLIDLGRVPMATIIVSNERFG